MQKKLGKGQKVIKYQGKKLTISNNDYMGITYAQSVGRERVDVQQPNGKDKFKVVWLNVAEIKE